MSPLSLRLLLSPPPPPPRAIAQDEEPQQKQVGERIPDYGNTVLLGTVPVDDKVDALAFTPDSKILIASDKDTFRAYNANTGEAVKKISAPEGVRSNFVLFTADGKTMITANNDGAIRFYDWETGEVKQTLEGHRSPMVGLVLSPSGKLLASSGTDRLVKVWDVETGKLVQELSGLSYAAPILIFSEDEKQLTTVGGALSLSGIGGKSSTGRSEKSVWNLENGSSEQANMVDDFGPPFAVTADGKAVVGMGVMRTKISSTDFTIQTGLHRYNVATGELGSSVLTVGSEVSLLGPNTYLTFAPNKAVLAIGVSFGGSTYLWGGAPVTLAQLPFINGTGGTKVETFSPDSRLLATWKDNLKVNIYRAP